MFVAAECIQTADDDRTLDGHVEGYVEIADGGTTQVESQYRGKALTFLDRAIADKLSAIAAVSRAIANGESD